MLLVLSFVYPHGNHLSQLRALTFDAKVKLILYERRPSMTKWRYCFEMHNDISYLSYDQKHIDVSNVRSWLEQFLLFFKYSSISKLKFLAM
jgi:hypothetical protein